MGTDAYTQEELEANICDLELAFEALYGYAHIQDWPAYRAKMRQIDLLYRQLRSQGPDLGARPTRQ